MSYDERIIEVDPYNAIGLHEYDGKYSLVALELKGDSVWHKIWVFLSKWRSGEAVPDNKKRPMMVKLGDKATARKVVKVIYDKI